MRVWCLKSCTCIIAHWDNGVAISAEMVESLPGRHFEYTSWPSCCVKEVVFISFCVLVCVSSGLLRQLWVIGRPLVSLVRESCGWLAGHSCHWLVRESCGWLAGHWSEFRNVLVSFDVAKLDITSRCQMLCNFARWRHSPILSGALQLSWLWLLASSCMVWSSCQRFALSEYF